MDKNVFDILNTKKVFLFDYDGTIVNNQVVNFEIMKRFFKFYNKECDMQTNLYLRTLTARELMEKCCTIFGVDLDFDECVQQYTKAVKEVMSETNQDCFEYVKFLCENCKTQQFVLLSNNLTDFLEGQLKKFGISQHFSKVIGCASENITKEQVYGKVEEIFGVKPEDCVLFEDAQKYLDAGKQAGFTTVGIEYWFNKGEVKADFVIDAEKETISCQNQKCA